MTSWMWWVSGGVILIVTVATLAWTYGARIDRLHRRIASARLRLDRHLVKRSAEAVRLADSGALTKEDSNALREVATAALSAAEFPLAEDSLGGFARQGRGSAEDSALRRHAESSLSQVLRSTLTPELRGELEQSVLTHTQLDVLALRPTGREWLATCTTRMSPMYAGSVPSRLHACFTSVVEHRCHSMWI